MSIKQKISLALATCGVGYLPLAPGTWGSALAVVGYFGYQRLLELGITDQRLWAPLTAVLLTAFCVLGIKASKIAADAMGEKDPSKIVVDEVMGQWVTFAFIPFTSDWRLLLSGFLLFRLFDIWKPFPVDATQNMGEGIGICADDIVAGVYAGVLLLVISVIL
jgi:phosphatidylglycerophosphatase A